MPPIRWGARRRRSISSPPRRNTKWSASMKDMNRRSFLRKTVALSTAGLAGALDLFPLAASAATGDYKALVCIFLFGGVDGNSVLVPIDTAGYGAYAAVRGANSGIQLTRAELLPIAPLAPNTYQSFGLHPSLDELKT